MPQAPQADARAMRIALAIDAGGSSTRWAVVRLDGPSAVLQRGAVGPLSGLSFLPGADARARAAGEGVVSDLSRDVIAALRSFVAGETSRTSQASTTFSDRPRWARVLAGVTGTTSGDPATVQIRTSLIDALMQGTTSSDGSVTGELDASNVSVVSDLELMHAASFEPGEGILLYAGTGSIAVHRTADLRWLRVGGHGYLVDDAGGGFWIGQRAVRAWMRAWDAATTPDARAALKAQPVYAALEARVGSRDWSAVRAFVYGGGRAAVASLVPVVAAAARAGDPLAASWIADAGGELARLAAVLARKIDEDLGRTERSTTPVAVAGGVTHVGTLLIDAIDAALPEGMTASIASRSPLDAAVATLTR